MSRFCFRSSFVIGMITMQALLAPQAAVATEERSPRLRERVIDLPEDGGRWHTTLVLAGAPESDARSRQVVELFASSPRLVTLSAQTHVHRFTPSDPLYQTRYAPYFAGQLPAILVQKADGAVVYKVSGDAIPLHAEQLADEIAAAIDQCCPVRPQPSVTPVPQPETRPDKQPSVKPFAPSVNVDLIPDIRPEPPKEPATEPVAPSEKAPARQPISPLAWIAPLVAGAMGMRRPASRFV